MGLTPLRSLIRPSVRADQPADQRSGTLTAEEQRAKRQAEFILKSAAKARGEIVDDDEQLDPRAAAILAAGRARRNER